jgi:hypothetical protein
VKENSAVTSIDEENENDGNENPFSPDELCYTNSNDEKE